MTLRRSSNYQIDYVWYPSLMSEKSLEFVSLAQCSSHSGAHIITVFILLPCLCCMFCLQLGAHIITIFILLPCICFIFCVQLGAYYKHKLRDVLLVNMVTTYTLLNVIKLNLWADQSFCRIEMLSIFKTNKGIVSFSDTSLKSLYIPSNFLHMFPKLHRLVWSDTFIDWARQIIDETYI